MMSVTQKQSRFFGIYPIIVLSLAACFLFYKYILQIVPSIITTQLMHQFHLNGVELGALAASFYYSYMLTQLFVGFLLDRYSTRRLTTIAIFISALGMFLFSQSSTIAIASLSRALMGVGVAFATVSYMKLASTWFPQHYAFVSGLLATAAMSGAVFGQAPLAWFIEHYDWHDCLAQVGLVGFGLACLFFVVVQDTPGCSLPQSTLKRPNFREILQVFKNSQNWLLTIYSGLAFAPVAVFGGLWGNPFLEQAYQLSKTQTASLVSLVFIGLGIGSPVLGLLSERLQNRRHVMLMSTLGSCVAISVVLYGRGLPIGLLSMLLFAFGFGLGAFMLVFAIGKEHNSLSLTATVIAMINTSDAVLDAVTEPLIGKILDTHSSGILVNGIPYFSLANYQVALSILPIYLILASCLLLWLKETP